MLAFSNEETRRVREEGTGGIYAESEEKLEGQRETPCDVAWRKRQAEREPVRDTETGYAVGYK